MIWLDRISPVVNTVWTGRWRDDFIEAARTLYDHELVVFAHGRCRLEIGGESLDCPAGSWAIVPPLTLHKSWAVSPGVFRYCVHFDWVGARERRERPICVYAPARPRRALALKAPGFVPPGPHTGRLDTAGGVLALLETLSLRWHGRCETDRRTARAVLLEVLLRLFDESEPAPARPDRASRLAYAVKQRLDEMPSQEVSIRDHLEALGMSYAHLARVFRRAFGVTPGRYLNAIRIEAARELLKHPGASVAETAYRTGFSDPAYFSRTFKKLTGVSPRDYPAEGQPQDKPT